METRSFANALGAASHRWWPSSWQLKPAAQQAEYEDQEALNNTLSRLRKMSPLVRSEETASLRRQLASVALGWGFLLHGGDCAERFSDIHHLELNNKVRLLTQMGLLIQHATQQPVVRLARMAGQFAKPRSQPMETVNGVKLPVYRGDIVNDTEATAEARRADPKRLLQAYLHSAMVLNHVRGLNGNSVKSLGLVDDDWHLGLLAGMESGGHGYRQTVWQLNNLIQSPHADPLNLYVSHEGLHLPYEESLTGVGSDAHTYNLGTHYLWLGERTRQLDGAHVEYFRGIHNPIGVKVSANCKPHELQEMIRVLNPDNEPGRLTLITRFGKDKIAQALPGLINAVREMGAHVVWSCDPMHGNGQVSSQGIKTRAFDTILSEVRSAFAIHEAEGSRLGGLHLECTGAEVTECLGGSVEITEEDLSSNYTTACDPRLNVSQSLELIYLVRDALQRQSRRSEDALPEQLRSLA